MSLDRQSTSSASGDVTYGDKITVGNVTDSYAAIGNGAQVIVNQIQQALSKVDELDKSIQAAERRLAESIQKKLYGYTKLTATDVDARDNPYKALLDYKIEDAPFFYGRTEAIKAMQGKMQQSRLTILQSDSGSGKTSLLQAGLASRLLAEGQFPLYLRPYNQPPGQSIKKSFLPDFATQEELKRFSDEQMTLHGFLERVTHYLGERRLIIFLDQFEEFFTELTPDDQKEFASQLRECVQSDLPVWWVLALRKDYFSDLRLFEALKPFENEYFLPTFKMNEAQEVIVEPASLKGVAYEDGLVDQILDDIRLQTDVIPPAQVQLVCYTLFDELSAKDDPLLITVGLYKKPRGRGAGAPGAEGILTSHLSRVLDRDLKGKERKVATLVLEALVTSDLRRVVRSERSLQDALEPEQAAQLENVLKVLFNNRLVRRELDENDRPLYELAHDYLLGEIDLDPDTRERKFAQEMLDYDVRVWRQNLPGKEVLIAEDRFNIINDQRYNLHIDEAAAELLEKSEAAIAAKRRQELEQAQKLAEEQRLRAEEGEKAAHDLRQRLILVTVAVVIALVAFGAAVVLGLQSQSNANIAATAAIEADDQRDAALVASTAEAQQRATADASAAEADRQRNLADTAAVEANEQRVTAEASAAEAERQTNIARSRQLAAESLNMLEIDPEQALLLAMEAIAITETMKEPPVIPEALNALHRAVQSSRVQKLITVHSGIVFDVAYSQDGKYLVSGGLDGNVNIWDLETGDPPITLPRDAPPPTNTKFSRDGKYLYLADLIGNVEVWDLATMQLLPEKSMSVHEGAIIDAELTTDGLLLATTGEDSTTRIINLATSEVIQEIPLDGVGCGVAFNAGGSQVVIGDLDGNVYLWDLEAKEEFHRFVHASEHQAACAVAFSPDNDILATGGVDTNTKLWSLETNDPLSTLTGHTDTIWRIVFSPDGKLLASAGFDNKAYIYDRSSGKLLQTLAGHKGPLRALAFAPDSGQLASSDESGEIRLWDVSFGHHSDLISKVMFSPDGSFFASAGADGTIKVWESHSESLVRQFDINGRVWDFDIHPQELLIAAVSDNDLVQIWDIAANKSVSEFPVNAASAGTIDYSPDGQLLAVAGDEGVILWDTQSQNQVDFIPTPQQNYSVAFNSDGTSLAVVSADFIVRVWDLTSGELKFTLTHEPNLEVFRVTFSPNDNLLATAGVGGIVKLWDAKTGEFVSEISGHTQSVYDVRFNYDGNLLVTSSAEPSVKVWDLSLVADNPQISGSIIEFEDFDGLVYSVNFSPDGREVVAAGADQLIRRYTLSLDDLVEDTEQRLSELKN